MSSRLSNDPADSQEAVFRFLADPKTHGLSEPVVRVDTANAVVFLAGPDAYKVKRAVKFPFMDLSTLDKRRRACEAEIAVNRADAPGVYLAALPITRKRRHARNRGRGRNRRMGHPHAAIRRERDARPRRRARRRLGRRSSTSWRSRSAAPTPARRCGTRRGPRMPSRPTSSRTTPLSPSGPIFSIAATARKAHRRFAARFRDRAAGPPQARRGWFHAPLSWRSAPAQHCHARRRADFVRCGRVFGRGRERRRALRSCLFADGSGGARLARFRQSALQPLSRARSRRRRCRASPRCRCS